MGIVEMLILGVISLIISRIGEEYSPHTTGTGCVLTIIAGLIAWYFTGNGWGVFFISAIVFHPIMVSISLIYLLLKSWGLFNIKSPKKCPRCGSPMKFKVNPKMYGVKYVGGYYVCKNCNHINPEDGNLTYETKK